MEGNIVKIKSLGFSLRIVKLYKYLTNNKREFVLSKQILRSGTSIGANIEEAIGGQSRKDFFSKICIAYKEARETSYWLKVLRNGNYLNNIEFESIFFDCDELCKILGKIKITTEKNNS
jgi:four helix bundle protein